MTPLTSSLTKTQWCHPSMVVWSTPSRSQRSWSLLLLPARHRTSPLLATTAAFTRTSPDPVPKTQLLEPGLLASFNQTDTVMPVLIVLNASIGTSMSVLSLKISEPPNCPSPGFQTPKFPGPSTTASRPYLELSRAVPPSVSSSLYQITKCGSSAGFAVMPAQAAFKHIITLKKTIHLNQLNSITISLTPKPRVIEIFFA